MPTDENKGSFIMFALVCWMKVNLVIKTRLSRCFSYLQNETPYPSHPNT